MKLRHQVSLLVLFLHLNLGLGQWTVDGSPPSNNIYAKVSQPTRQQGISFTDLPGFTRSVYERDHALIAPESRVFGGFPGWTSTNVAVLISPEMGSHFTMYMANLTPESKGKNPVIEGVERFVFVLDGELHVTEGTEATEHVLPHGGFIYFPPQHDHRISTPTAASVLVFERFYVEPQMPPFDPPHLQVGYTDSYPLIPTPGEIFKLRKLMPQTSEYDFNIHIMDFEPGEYLNVKELHYNQHGLLLLEGQGIYRLSDKWYPVQAGDVIYMAPFVTQWYGALGKERSRYILYKDTNREPLLKYAA
mmetsp:Transcript_1930/g.2159  ORF Transcript_1930/g.2159 Transcript_1930/m.2159 type:complete len:304 (-) Transcript_1930:222-1133(-)|eukprot:CAMPEP_0197856146 /NCGR_PEP_ID=MMETSP1438-20131217/27975_1 /TAXON_ID=1461541 /ORGANISM="Pterosperma sp., Strain CCMP1384" /LENGTH=303 /DNA_ID=CAMNT_0043471501 /DNA_START=173 /DNA_END=1084 /DNA_ORIENTATION=+